MLGSLSAALYFFSVVVSCSYRGLHVTALVTVTVITLSQRRGALEVSY